MLILGCGRSGTSIFGELFEHIPNYIYYSEPDFALIQDLDFNQPTAIKVPKENNQFEATTGLSFPLAQMLDWLPKPHRTYWQIRHPLDAISSLKVGIANNWGHHPRPPDWQNWLSKPLVVQCAYHWQFINKIGYQQIKDRVKVTYFESMLRNPQQFAYQICRDVEIDPEQVDNQLSGWYQRVQNTNNSKFIEAQTSRFYSRNDHKTRINRWKENLSQKEIDLIKPIISETASNFGYELT